MKRKRRNKILVKPRKEFRKERSLERKRKGS